MIVKMLNLTCSAGHRYFAPNPEVWVGRECLKTEGDGRKHGCAQKLKRI